jgi:hypothetical protein
MVKIFYPEDGGSRLLQNVGNFSTRLPVITPLKTVISLVTTKRITNSAISELHLPRPTVKKIPYKIFTLLYAYIENNIMSHSMDSIVE